MAIQSMTGFAGSEGHANCATASGRWVWELRSVNAKGLDIRLRLPPGFDAVETEARKRISAGFSRGNIQASLQFEPEGAGAVPVVNEDALNAVLAAVSGLQKRIGSPPPAAEAILAIRGVMDSGEASAEPEDLARRDKAVLAGLEEACSQLAQARAAEGKAVASALAVHVDGIEALTKQVETDTSRSPEAIRARLEKALAPLMDGASAIDPQRLHQEAALLAVKADLSEEIDRLHAHVAAARQLLAGEGPAGRRLDFLSQEFNRECNTICSKSNASAVTSAGLEMKVLVDRFREQLQNIE